GHLRVEVVLQHAIGRFLQPALAVERGPPRRAHGSRRHLGVLGWNAPLSFDAHGPSPLLGILDDVDSSSGLSANGCQSYMMSAHSTRQRAPDAQRISCTTN